MRIGSALPGRDLNRRARGGWEIGNTPNARRLMRAKDWADLKLPRRQSRWGTTSQCKFRRSTTSGDSDITPYDNYPDVTDRYDGQRGRS